MTFEKIYKIVRSIPKGRVASYGQIAAIAGHPRGAQMVGWALHQLKGPALKNVPWQRVINARGEISISNANCPAELQAKLLRKDGVQVKLTPEKVYKIDIKKYGWLI